MQGATKPEGGLAPADRAPDSSVSAAPPPTEAPTPRGPHLPLKLRPLERTPHSDPSSELPTEAPTPRANCQFVGFETAYVLQSQYDIKGQQLAAVIRDLVTTPGIETIDDCPWPRILELWPDPLPGLADAFIVAVAASGRHDTLATFDRKLSRRAKDLGVTAYW